MNASDILVARLLAWGVDTVFGLPGDGINGVFEALRKEKDRIQFIHVRHEESAALMACAYAKFTGRLGVCIATSGARRHSLVEWSVRRKDGSGACVGNYGPSA